MKSFTYTLITSLTLFAVFIAIDAYRMGHFSNSSIGIAGYILCEIYLTCGLILVLFKKTRMMAAALLLSAGLMLLIGYTFCSTFSHGAIR